MKTKLFILMLFISLSAVGQGVSELYKGLIFRAPLSEWNPTRDEVSNTIGTATNCYNVLSRDGSGRRELTYNGSTSYSTLPTIPAFGTGDFTVIMKINTKSLAVNQCVLGGVEASFGLRIATDGRLQVVSIATVGVGYSTNIISINTDYVITYIRASGTGTFYFNGIKDNVTITDGTTYTNACTRLGYQTAGEILPFSGSISLCRIFNYALTPTQIANYSKPEYPIEWVDRGGGTSLYSTDFTSSTGWALGAGWSINTGTGKALRDGTAASSDLYRIPTNTVGKRIRSTIVVDAVTGSFNYVYSNTTNMPISAAGTYTAEGIIPSFEYLYIYNNAGATITIDAISVTQLGCVLDLNASGLSGTGDIWVDRTNSTAGTTDKHADNSNTTLVVPSASNLGGTSFNGSTSKVAFTGLPTFGTSDFTLSFWINFNAITGNQGVIGGSGCNFFFSGGALYIDNGVVGINNLTSISTNEWNNIVYSRRNGVGTLYKNRIKISSYTDTINYGAMSQVGAYGNGSSGFVNSIITNVNFWKTGIDSDSAYLIYDTNF